MARKRINECGKYTVTLCEENRGIVLQVKAKIEKSHQSSISEAINLIIAQWNESKTI